MDINPPTNKRRDKIQIDNSKLYFGFVRLSLVLAFCVTIVILTQTFYYFILYPTAEKIDGLVKIFIVSVESWSVLVSCNVFFFETVFWNNTAGAWNQDSLATFEYFSDRLESNIIRNFTAALDYNMGNYSSIYQNQMMVSLAHFLIF
jgi:hypothetical protein